MDCSTKLTTAEGRGRTRKDLLRALINALSHIHRCPLLYALSVLLIHLHCMQTQKHTILSKEVGYRGSTWINKRRTCRVYAKANCRYEWFRAASCIEHQLRGPEAKVDDAATYPGRFRAYRRPKDCAILLLVRQTPKWTERRAASDLAPFNRILQPIIRCRSYLGS